MSAALQVKMMIVFIIFMLFPMELVTGAPMKRPPAHDNIEDSETFEDVTWIADDMAAATPAHKKAIPRKAAHVKAITEEAITEEAMEMFAASVTGEPTELPPAQEYTDSEQYKDITWIADVIETAPAQGTSGRSNHTVLYAVLGAALITFIAAVAILYFMMHKKMKKKNSNIDEDVEKGADASTPDDSPQVE